MKKNDQIGDILRKFYSLYGRPKEAPSHDHDVSELLPELNSDILSDLKLLTQICNNPIDKKFCKCRDLLEKIADLLSDSTQLLKELDEISNHIEPEIINLSNGIFWYTLATSLEPNGKNGQDLKLPDKIPYFFRKQLQIQGALIFRLYMSLVYMKSGAIEKILNIGLQAKKPTLILCQQLLNCDYVRHLRNSLAHANFRATIAGINFKDNNFECVATPGFLDWLCIWVFLIHYNCICVIGKNGNLTIQST